MTIYLDTSAVIATAIDGGERNVVLSALQKDPIWCSSAMTLTEVAGLIPRITSDRATQSALEDQIRQLWDYLYLIPVDQACLDRASRISQEHLLRTSLAIHLASFGRLPSPSWLITFDHDLILASNALRISTLEDLLT